MGPQELIGRGEESNAQLVHRKAALVMDGSAEDIAHADPLPGSRGGEDLDQPLQISPVIDGQLSEPGLQLHPVHHQEEMIRLVDVSARDATVMKAFPALQLLWHPVDKPPDDDGPA